MYNFYNHLTHVRYIHIKCFVVFATSCWFACLCVRAYYCVTNSESTYQTTDEREQHNPIYGVNYDNVGPSSENGPENSNLNKPSGDNEFAYNLPYGEASQLYGKETRVSGQDPQNTDDMYTYIATDSPTREDSGTNLVGRGQR